jgi:hypothetical protein
VSAADKISDLKKIDGKNISSPKRSGLAQSAILGRQEG